ncbi:glycosyl hydrolase [Haematococcus lacustris]
MAGASASDPQQHAAWSSENAIKTDEFTRLLESPPHSSPCSTFSIAVDKIAKHTSSGARPYRAGWLRCLALAKASLAICIVSAVGALLTLTAINMLSPGSLLPPPRPHAASTPEELAALHALINSHVSHTLPEGVLLNLASTNGSPIIKAAKVPAPEALPYVDPRINYSSLLKPGFHLTAPYGWMNDPNGMFQGPGGVYHAFFQWNPFKAVWGPPWWGHVVSTDLARWRLLPPALVPDQWYDRDGVFSGSATLDEQGQPFMMYTGVMNFSQYGFYYQVQAAAVPANLSDPYLTNWTKLASNPLSMEIPPGGTHAQFRDPTTAWQVPHSQVEGLLLRLEQTQPGRPPNTTRAALRAARQGQGQNCSQAGQGRLGQQGEGCGGAGQGPPGVWVTAVGTLDDCLGAASLYLSQDGLLTWVYAGTLFSQLSQNYSRYSACLPPPEDRDQGGAGSEPVPAGSRGYGGHCDQFGKDCRMWECPDFFSVSPDLQAFKYSDQERGRHPFAADFYLLGEAALTNYTAALNQDEADAFTGTVARLPYQAQPLDAGSVYASKTFQDAAGRRLWLGWVYEDSIGCTEVCGDGTPFITDQLGWQGAQSLPRVITLDPEAQGQMQLESGRQAAGRAGQCQCAAADVAAGGVGVRAGGAGDACSQSSPSGHRQAEVLLQFKLRWDDAGGGGQGQAGGVDSPFLLGLRLLTGNGTFTDFYLNGTARLPDSAQATPPSGSPLSPPSAAAVPAPPSVSREAVARRAPQQGLITQLQVHADRQFSGGMSHRGVQGQVVKLPTQGLLAADNITLQVFVDRSIVEVYALGGRAVLTSRIYPFPVLPGASNATVAAAAPLLAATGANGSLSTGTGGGVGAKGLQPDVVPLELLGAWGMQVMVAWPQGPVHVDASVWEMGSCWEAQ